MFGFISLPVESILYYLSILLLSINLFGGKLKSRVLFFLSFILYIPAVFPVVFDLPEIFNLVIIPDYILWILPTILSILLLSKIKKKSLIFVILFVYLFSFVLSATVDIIAGLIYQSEVFRTIVDLVINILIFIMYIIVCNGKWKFSISKSIDLIPTKVKIVTLSSWLVGGFLATFFLAIDSVSLTYNYIFVMKLFMAILILLIDVTCPLLIANSLSSEFYRVQSQMLKNQVDNQVKYYTSVSQKNYEISKFRHDYKNVNITLSRLLEKGDVESAREFLDKQANRFNVIDSVSLFNTGNDIVDALLGEKVAAAKKCNINISFEGVMPKEKISAEDICIIFGNAIDNAIEACEKITDDIEKNISVTSKLQAGFLKIVIANPVSSPVKFENGMPITTKKDKSRHGFGLYSIGESVRKYDGEMKVSADDSKFTLEIILNLN